MSLVFESWYFVPFTLQRITKPLGSSTSSVVVSHGPTGAKFRNDLPSENCAGTPRIWRARSE